MTQGPQQQPPGQRFGGDLLNEIFENSLDPGYVEAARQGRRAGIAGTLGRIVTLMAVGMLLAIAYMKVVADAPETIKTREKLIADIRRNQSSADQLENQTDELREQVAQLRDRALNDAGGDAAYLRGLEALTGLGKVSGDGITVTIGDADNAKDPVTGRTKPGSSGKVYDRDLQRVVNALWSAGAEAVAINDQRISGTSTIRAAGDAILVDFRPVSNPYHIEAVGPDDLEKRFQVTLSARQFRGYVNTYGMTFTVRKDNSLTLPAAGDPQLRFATPTATAQASLSPSLTGGGR